MRLEKAIQLGEWDPEAGIRVGDSPYSFCYRSHMRTKLYICYIYVGVLTCLMDSLHHQQEDLGVLGVSESTSHPSTLDTHPYQGCDSEVIERRTRCQHTQSQSHAKDGEAWR